MRRRPQIPDGFFIYLFFSQAAIYNDVSCAHQRYNFLQKLRSGTWYSMEDVYQIISLCSLICILLREVGGSDGNGRCVGLKGPQRLHVKAGKRL